MRCNLRHIRIRKEGRGAINVSWWRWVELNYRSIGYEPIALTSEPHRQDYELIISNKNANVKTFSKIV